MRLSNEQLDLLEVMSEKATPGPWKVTEYSCGCCWNVEPTEDVEYTFEHDDIIAYEVGGNPAFCYNNAQLIAAFRTALPELIAEVRESRKR